jgi:peroxiredoxin
MLTPCSFPQLEDIVIPDKHEDIPVPDISLNDANGKSIRLRELAGDDGMVVGFLHGTYCPSCVQQLNRANRYAEVLRQHHVNLAWILADKPDNIATWQLAALPAPEYNILPDRTPSIKRDLGLDEDENHPTPSVLYLDAEGHMRYVEATENPHAPFNLEALVNAIEADKESD